MCQAAVHLSCTASFNTGWLVEVCGASTLNIPTSASISILVNLFYFRRRLTASQTAVTLGDKLSQLAVRTHLLRSLWPSRG
jgi:hypothetical protein